MKTSNNNQPATKDDLGKLEENLRSDLVTKDDLGKLEENLRSDFANEFTRSEYKTDKRFDKLEKNMTGWKDDILTALDKQNKVLDNITTEQAASFDNYKRLDSKVEKHEDYIVKADKKLKIGFEQA
jgi:predicted  nucleic acid-binding Zn-ribbon protein